MITVIYVWNLCYKDMYEGVITSVRIIVVDTKEFPITVVYERY